MAGPTVFLVSSTDFVIHDHETAYIKKALNKRGFKASINNWDDPKVDWSQSDLTISRGTSTYIWRGNTQKFLEWSRQVEEKSTLWNPSHLMEWNHHKKYLIELQKHGIPMPETILIPQNIDQSMKEILDTIPWNDFIIKPCIGAGSCGLRRFTKESPDLETHFKKLNKYGYKQVYSFGEPEFNPCDTLVQPYVPEVTSSGEASLIFFGGEYSHSVIKKVKAGDYRAHPIWGAVVQLYHPSTEEVEACYRALSVAPSDSHYARIDLIPASSGPLLIEVELIDPMFFFDHVLETVESFADHIENSLKS